MLYLCHRRLPRLFRVAAAALVMCLFITSPSLAGELRPASENEIILPDESDESFAADENWEEADELPVFNPDNSAASETPPDSLGDTTAQSDSVLLTTTAQAPGGAVTFTERPEDSSFILELALDERTIIDRAMPVFLEEDDVLIPLGHFSAAIGFPIAVDTAKATASGWFVAEANTFLLQAPFTEAVIRGVPQPVSTIVENHIDDIYVSFREIEKWFPVKLTMDFNNLRMMLSTTEQLAFQAQAERQSRWDRIRGQSTALEPENFDDVIFLPYKKVSPPAVQISHNLQYNKSAADTNAPTTTTVQAYGDLLEHSARLNFGLNTGSSNSNGVNNLNFTMGREDFRGNLLGPLNATQYEFGDINSAAFPLSGGQQRGRGVTLSNAPANFIRDVNAFVIRGFGPVGWDVEVYQDEQILDFLTIGADGRYDFEDLELREGFNLFRIVLYGPNGEKEERFERFYLGQNMLEPGKFVYEFSTLESSTPLFNINNQATTPETVSLLGEYGVTKNLSAYAGYFRGPLGPTDLNSFGAGLRLSSNRFFTQLSTLTDVDGAYSASIDTTGNLGKNITIGAGHVEHQNYDVGVRGDVRETYARFSQMFSFKDLNLGSYSFEARRSISDTNVRTDTFSNRISGSFFGLNLSNDIQLRKTDTGNSDPDIEGSLTARYRSSLGLFRGRLNYRLDGSETLDSGEIQFQTNLSPKTFLNLSVNSSFTGTKQQTYSASIDHQFDKFQLGVNGAFTNQSDVRLGMALTYNLIPRSPAGDYYLTGSSRALSSGQLGVMPFLDGNENGTMDEGENPIPGVTLRNLIRGTRSVSDEKGLALIDSLSPGSVNKIQIDAKTLPDIYMTPGKEQIKVFGKTGVHGPLHYPVTLLGEISGTLAAMVADPLDPTAEAQRTDLTATEILLLNDKDEVVAQAFSEYDGYFTFQSLRMGEYKIYLPPTAKISAISSGERTSKPLRLAPEQTEVSGIDVLLTSDQLLIDE